MKYEHITDGYIEDVITEDHYTYGALSTARQFKDRNWIAYLPSEEYQKVRRIETSNCTAFGTLNAFEGYMRRVYGHEYNYSDRYLGSRAGTTSAGNSPHKVIETLRNYAGCISEAELPFSDDVQNVDDYYGGVTFSHKLSGVKWLRDWEVKHEWVLTGQETNWQDQLYDSLLFSPIGIAVNAWHEDNGMYVRKNKDNHWTDLVYAVKGHYWVVWDSYAPFLKKLDWNYGFTRAKRYEVFPREDYSLQFYARLGLGLVS